MELYDDVEKKEKSKLPMIIGIFIGVLIVLIIAIICAIMYLKSMILTIKIDGQTKNELENILYIEENDNIKRLYIPIRKIASYFGYEDYRGDYSIKSEDSNKCYVKNEYEVVMFTKDSSTYVKINEKGDYEYLESDDIIFEKDGELYTTAEVIENTFNVLFEYNLEENKINIYTMDYLNQLYATKLGIATNSESDGLSVANSYSNQKAIFSDMMVVTENGKYGVVSATTGEFILEAKYEEIECWRGPTFLVKTNGKYGLLKEDTSVKAKIIYDEIKIIDDIKQIYLVKKNNLYGVLDSEGKMIIEPSYSQIGIDTSKYQQNGVENKYILLDKLIPVKNSDGLWGIFDLDGNKIKDFEFTEIGCDTTKNSNVYSAVIIPSYKIIVVGKDGYYNLMTEEGELLISSFLLNSIYIKVDAETEENKFYMTTDNSEKEIDTIKWLTSIGK